MHRRRYVASVASAGSFASAGCLGDILDDATTFSANPAEVADSAATDAGYEHEGTESRTDEREFAGETVEVTSHFGRYHRSLEIPAVGEKRAGVFATIATPKVNVAGKEFNPVGEMDDEEIVGYLQDQYSQLSIEGTRGRRTVQTLGSSEEVTTFAGRATLADGIDLDVLLDVAKFEHGDDFVVVVGIYPEDLPDEGDRVTTMIEGLEHEA